MSIHASTWLSVGPETLVRALEQSGDKDVDCDVLIVGSGYGGSVAAARLADATTDDGGGRPRRATVWLVERGREYLRGMFPTRFAELPGHIRFSKQDGDPARGYAHALFDVRLGDDVNVILGSGLGGGSLINAGVMERPSKDVLAGDWPAALAGDALEQGYERALAMLNPAPVPEGQTVSKFDVLEQTAQAHGQRASRCKVAVNFVSGKSTPAGVEMQACTACGDCVTGCNQGAKLTLDTNYLAQARRNGAQLFCGATVERVLKTSEDCWTVQWHYTEPSQRPPDSAAFTIRARNVILAAGALGSTEILLRSKPGLALPEAADGGVGTRFSTNGDMILAGLRHNSRVNACANEDSDPSDPGARLVGPTITGIVRVASAAGAPPLVVEEFGVPAALRPVFGEILSTFGLFSGADMAVPEHNTGEDPAAVTSATLQNSNLYGFMGDDGAQGRLVLEPARGASQVHRFGDGAIRVDWRNAGDLPVFEKQFEWLNSACSHASGSPGGSAVANPIWRPLGKDGPAKGPLTTVHPLGGCPMGADCSTGTVNQFGQVFDPAGGVYRGLAVLDGSIVPRALGVNPALTIAALAERAVAQLRQEWFHECTPVPVDLGARPVWARSRRPVRDVATGVEINERMQGPLKIGDQRYWAQLTVNLAEIEDLEQLVRRLPREVNIRSADLELAEADESHDEFSSLLPLAKRASATLSGTVKLFHVQSEAQSGVRFMVYDLAVEKTDGPWPAIQSIKGVKEIGLPDHGGPLRQLMEMRISIDGVDTGQVWKLDLGYLVRIQQPLLHLTRQATLPDALADLAGLGTFVGRLTLGTLFGSAADLGDMPQHIGERYPGILDKKLPQQHWVDSIVGGERKKLGVLLSLYSSGAAPGSSQHRPVLLIHGFGASGSTFAHHSIPRNLVQFLLEGKRDVWVLDLRTSIGNEPENPGDPRSGPWTFDEVAQGDLPPALEFVQNHAGQKVDVVAHCIGAAMFCVAALTCRGFSDRVGTVVLSQVGPLVELSPANRLRGYVASYIEQFMGIDEFDTRPDYRRVVRDGVHVWEKDDANATVSLVDLLLTAFPYPEDDEETRRAQSLGTKFDFRRVRHRADAIFGQLMELRNVGDETLKALDAIYGWVKVRSLAQTIHYARHRMLTNASGYNSALQREHFNAQFGFPVLMLHGQRNRVFDWRGSFESYKLLKNLRGAGPGEPVEEDGTLHWGGDTQQQLVIVKSYGHQDCLIGENASRDVFPAIGRFLDQHAGSPPPTAMRPASEFPIDCDEPWIGPALGWLRQLPGQRGYTASVLVHPSPRRPQTLAVAVVPMQKAASPGEADGWKPMLSEARGMVLDDPALVSAVRATASGKVGAPHVRFPEQGALLRRNALVLDVRPLPLQPQPFNTFAVVTLHADLNLPPDDVFERVAPEILFVQKPQWLEGSRPLAKRVLEELEKFFASGRRRVDLSMLHLGDDVLQAADRLPAIEGGHSARQKLPLGFALASCQYPPGLLDEDCAGTSFAQILKDAAEQTGSAIPCMAPQFLLLTGDQVYLDATAGVFDPGARSSNPDDTTVKSYELNWRLPQFRRLAGRLPIYTMLDDHEVGDNWQPAPGDQGNAQVRSALSGYHNFQGKLNPPPVGAGLSYTFSPSGTSFFVLDTRSMRELRRAGPKGDGSTVESAQIVPNGVMRSLFEWLERLPADSVKFIVSPVPILPMERFEPSRSAERLMSDNWSGYPASLCRLLDFIRERQIGRVVFLSGDAHLSLATKLVFPDGNAVCSIVSSGLYAPWPFANSRREEFRLEGSISVACDGCEVRGEMETAPCGSLASYAVICLQPADGDPHAILHVSFRPQDGEPVDCAHDFRVPQLAWTVT